MTFSPLPTSKKKSFFIFMDKEKKIKTRPARVCVLRCTVRLFYSCVHTAERGSSTFMEQRTRLFSVMTSRSHKTGATHPSDLIYIFISFRVDTISERIDTGIQKAVNPVVDQLTQNIRDTLGIWHRPLSSLASGHPNPVAPPNTNPTTSSSDGMYRNRFYF